MAIDVISWFGSGLQSRMAEEEWAGIMKLQEYRRTAEEMVPDASKRERLVLKIADETGEVSEVPYRALLDTLADFESAAGESAECFRADAACYRAISHPIDEIAERLLFTYFVREAAVAGSAAQQIDHDLIAGGAAAPMPRDAATFEAAEAYREPIEGTGRSIDTSEVFGALLRDVRGLPAVTAHTLFWRGFVEFVPKTMLSRSRSLAELVDLYPLFESTFRRGAAGAPACDVLFFR